MKKCLLFLLLFAFPSFICADSINYDSKNLEETFKEENILYDLSNYEESDSKINIYLFRGAGCGHCHDFLQFVSNTLVKDYSDYFNLISYEVWYNSSNEILRDAVIKYLNIKSKGVPLIIIGNKFFIGYSENMNESIVDSLIEEFNNVDSEDVISLVEKKIEEDFNYEDIASKINKKTDGEKIYDIKKFIIIFSVVLVFVATLFMILKNKKN